MVAVALDWFAALVMVRRAAAAAAACVATTATVGTTHRSRLWLWLEKAKEPGRDFFIMFFGCSGTYLVLPDGDSSSSSACRFLLPHVQLTHTGFGFGFGLKKNLRKVLPYVGTYHMKIETMSTLCLSWSLPPPPMLVSFFGHRSLLADSFAVEALVATLALVSASA